MMNIIEVTDYNEGWNEYSKIVARVACKGCAIRNKDAWIALIKCGKMIAIEDTVFIKSGRRIVIEVD